MLFNINISAPTVSNMWKSRFSTYRCTAGWLGDQPGGFMCRSTHGGARAVRLIGWIYFLIDGWLDGWIDG